MPEFPSYEKDGTRYVLCHPLRKDLDRETRRRLLEFTEAKLEAKGRVILKLARLRPSVRKLLTLGKIPSLQELLHELLSE